MAEEKDKKGFLGKAMDAFSSKDEKEEISKLEEELAKAKKEAEASKKAIKSLLDQNVESKQDKAEAEKKAKEAEKRVTDLRSRLGQHEMKEREERVSKIKAIRENLEKPKIITVHTVESNNQTLSHIALKYYNHATPPYWKYLVEHNKEVLDGSEKNVRMGMKLEIPELPDELKD
jgi:septal ring factor EnvC (AmiA/AmiB activator)